MTANKCKTPIAEAVHEMMADAHSVGAIDKTTMREFDAMCLSKVEVLAAKEIQAIRKRAPEPTRG